MILTVNIWGAERMAHGWRMNSRLGASRHDVRLRRHADARESILCSVPRSQTVVFWNGDLGLCCIDYDQIVQLPNVKSSGFLSAFRSDEAARARRRGFAKQFKICQSCSYSNADKLGFMVDLRSAGALPSFRRDM